MKKKIVVLVCVCLSILILVGVGRWFASRNQVEFVNPNETLNSMNQIEKQYVQEFESIEYHARVFESDTKEYAMLIIETNMFEGKNQIKISYDSEKYILNTANPLVNGLEQFENDGMKTFEIEVESIKNYNIGFIKKSIENAVLKDDIIVE